MAGAKETPRQKLIGLMYLVLLAMLALQVSSAIIQKFQSLNDSIELSNGKIEKGNSEIIERIEAAVEKNKKAKEDVIVLDDAKKFHLETKKLLSFISSLKAELIKTSGGDKDETGAYPGAKEEEPVAQLMLGSGNQKKGKAYKLKTELDNYVNFANLFNKDREISHTFDLLAKNGNEDPIFKHDKEQSIKDFAHLNFESTPLVAALAVLSERESQILTIEAEVLNQLALKVGAENIPIDKIRPVINASGNYVVAGMEYNAEIFMAAYSSNYSPNMTFKGTPVAVDSQGVGSIKFRAGASNYDANGLSKQSWTGTVSFPKSNGEDSVYTVTQDYYVVKPVIQVQSAAIQNLYRNCGNKLNIAVPALGAEFQPQYEITGGTLSKGNNGKITVVPSAPRVRVKVKNQGVIIGNLDFKVNRVPAATFITNLDPKRGATPIQLSRVRLKAKPSDEFRRLLPHEVNYKLPEIKVYLVKHGRVKKSITISGGNSINLRNKLNAQTGDILVMEVIQTTRTNYQGRTESAKINNPIITIPII